MRIMKAFIAFGCLSSKKSPYFRLSNNRIYFENNIIKRSITHSNRIVNDNKYFIVNNNDMCTNVLIIPMYKDNYSYIFYDDKEKAVAVDPSDYKKVNEIAEHENIKIKHVLCTHKHPDHNNGNKFFYNNKINVIGIKEHDNKHINNNIEHTNTFQINDYKIYTFISNFHCKNHISYLVQNEKNKLVKKNIFFTGDFLFICGIGKNFEAKNIDMYNSLNKLKKIDKKNTYIFCGHEYTLNNIQFALSVDADNEKLTEFYNQVLQNNKNLPTVPSLLEQEFLYNPFLRCHEKNIKKAVETYAHKNNYTIDKQSDYLMLLRIMKDNFKQ
ncbi:targeted glyoxalase II, putative [Hepatocystis sp. ex Piliocolobus tephrosceles]|nr:targeted glyoxalase II, putative [Hepatocystis sp. ex Piliocolobus tephrosceles]